MPFILFWIIPSLHYHYYSPNLHLLFPHFPALYPYFARTFPAVFSHWSYTIAVILPHSKRTLNAPECFWLYREWLWNQHHQTHLEELILFFIKLDPKKTKISLSKKLSQHNSTTKLNIYHKFWIYLYATNINLVKILFNLFSDTN